MRFGTDGTGEFPRLKSFDVARTAITEHDPELLDVLEGVFDATHEFRRIGLGEGPNAAASSVLSQALNDFTDLMRDLLDGRGRPALRAARGLVEHAANLEAVSSSGEMAERFLDHEHGRGPTDMDRANELFRYSRLPEPWTETEERRAQDAVRLAKLATEKSAVYGPGFLRGWHPKSLRDRLADLGEDASVYDFYTYASAILHGSSAGNAGIVITVEEEAPLVYRLGPILTLCPVAYTHGLKMFRKIVMLATWAGGSAQAVLLESLDRMDRHWPSYAAAVLAIAEESRPEMNPKVLSGLVITKGREPLWFLHNTELELLVKAQPSEAMPDMTAPLRLLEGDPLFEAGFPIRILTDVTLDRLPGEDWVTPKRFFTSGSQRRSRIILATARYVLHRLQERVQPH